MNSLVCETWNRNTRADIMESILSALNHSGTTEIAYFKEKSNILSYYLWRGHPQPVGKDDEWNLARITYNGVLAVEFIELRVHLLKATPVFGGRVFHEQFSESEIQQIQNALENAHIFTYQEHLSGKKKLFLSCVMVFYTLFALHTILMGNYGLSIIHFCCVFLAAWLRFMK